jgi:hypothetical protein
MFANQSVARTATTTLDRRATAAVAVAAQSRPTKQMRHVAVVTATKKRFQAQRAAIRRHRRRRASALEAVVTAAVAVR